MGGKWLGKKSPKEEGIWVAGPADPIHRKKRSTSNLLEASIMERNSYEKKGRVRENREKKKKQREYQESRNLMKATLR